MTGSNAGKAAAAGGILAALGLTSLYLVRRKAGA
jgi:LPXTG-motif cell wall-anchored protein